MATTDRDTLDAQLFGHETRVSYSGRAVGYALVAMRLTMGWILLQGGVTKLVTYLDGTPTNDWTAAGFLQNAIPAGNPLADTFAAMAGIPAVDMLVVWGLTLTGVGLVLGAFVRWNAFWGAVMMLIFWAASLQGGVAAGLPVAHGYVVDSHLVYAALLFGLGAFGAGRVLGVDAALEPALTERVPPLRYLLG